MSVKRTQLKIVKHAAFSYSTEASFLSNYSPGLSITCQDSFSFKSSVTLLALKQEMKESKMSLKFEEPQHYTCVYVSILVCMQDTCVSACTLAFDVANLYTMMLYICIYLFLSGDSHGQRILLGYIP